MHARQFLITSLLTALALSAQASKGLAVLFYSVDTTTDRLVTLDSDTGNVNEIGDIGFDAYDIDLTLLDNQLYGVGGYFGPTWTLYQFNTTTGAATRVADLPSDVQLAEGLTQQNGRLMVGFTTVPGSVFSSSIGELSLAGTLSNVVANPGVTGYPADTDGLTTSPTGKLYAIDYRSDLKTNVFFTPGQTSSIGQYTSQAEHGLNDLSFVGNTLFGISSYRTPLIARIDSTNGSLLQEIALNRAGEYFGLAPAKASSVPEPTSTLSLLAILVLGASLGTRKLDNR